MAKSSSPSHPISDFPSPRSGSTASGAAETSPSRALCHIRKGDPRTADPLLVQTF